MPIYICIRCGKNFKQKGHFKAHLNRKIICKPTNAMVSIQYIKEQYGFTMNKNTKPLSKSLTNSLRNNSKKTVSEDGPLTNITNHLTNNSDENLSCEFCNKLFTLQNNKKRHLEKFCKVKNSIKNKKSNLNCEFCNKVFTRLDNKKRHVAKYCKVKKGILSKTKKSCKKKKPNIIDGNGKDDKCVKNMIINGDVNTTNIINNYTQNNIINTEIQINGFGKEDTSYISEDIMKKIIMNPAKGIPKLVELIHFNPNHPENSNIKMINKKDSFLDYYNGDNWSFVDKKKMINYLITSKKALTDDYVDDAKINMDDEKIKAYDKYSEAIDYYIYKFILNSNTPPSKRSYKKIYRQLFNDILLMIVNHKRLVLDMHENALI